MSAQNNQQSQLSDLDKQQAAILMDFAKKNYPKVISADGKQIKIGGQFFDLTKIVEDVEDHFAELQNNFNNALIQQDSKEIRRTLYEFISFATSAVPDNLRQVDRGELRAIALVLGLLQQGFRDL